MSLTRSSWFLLLVCIQALHSTEEYLGELWQVFPPAVWLTSLVSDDGHQGFLIINIGLFVVGMALWYQFVRTEHKPVDFIVWFWILLELVNGIVHSIWSVIRGGYEPGLATAPLLILVAIGLMMSQLRSGRDSAGS